MASLGDTLAGRRLCARGVLENRVRGLWERSSVIHNLIWTCCEMRTRRAQLSGPALDGLRIARTETDARAKRVQNAHYRLACLLSGVKLAERYLYRPERVAKDD